MRKLAFPLMLAIVLAACSSSPQSGSTAAPGHGAIAISIDPNPIVAKPVSGNMYEFPFEVIVRETGGRKVEVQRVSVTVFAPGGFALGNEGWNADQIRGLGYPTSLAGNSEVRYRFSPRREVPDERLFNGVSAQLTVDAVDDTGAATSASTVVTIRR